MAYLVKDHNGHLYHKCKQYVIFQMESSIDIVKVNLAKGSSMLYKKRTIKEPNDEYELIKQLLGAVD